MLDLLGCFDIDKSLRLSGIPPTDVKSKDYGTSIHFTIKNTDKIRYLVASGYETFIEYRQRHLAGTGLSHIYCYYESPIWIADTKEVAGKMRLYRFHLAARSATELWTFNNMATFYRSETRVPEVMYT